MLSSSFLLAATLAANGPPSTGNDLLPQCNSALALIDEGRVGEASPSEAFRFGYCVGLVRGVMETIRAHDIGFGHKEFGCLPGGIESGQAARIVRKFLVEHPERLHEEDSLLVIAALRQAYPCTNAQGGR